MASNKHLVLSKIENFVKSKCYPENVSKDKERKANFRKSCKSFLTLDEQTYKGQTRVIFDNGGKKIIMHGTY